MDNTDIPQDVFIAGLRNAHAMENQALSIMRPQLERLENYPEVSGALERHIRETEGQIDRLDQILESQSATSSGLKDTMLSFTGAMAAMTHSVAADEILKNSLANYAFENFEIAAYTSLITIARMTGATSAISLLEQNLLEEQQMADGLAQMLPAVTQRYVTLRASGAQAGI